MVNCYYCGRQALLVSGTEIYPHRPDLTKTKFYLCRPCQAWVGVHPNSKNVPLGRLANAELRAAKSAAHRAFDPLWKEGAMKRKEAYKWLQGALGLSAEQCHIGMFNERQCRDVIRVCQLKRGCKQRK